MSKIKAELQAAKTWPPQLIIVANDKGGQGKSTTALAIADHATLYDAPLAAAQVDTQLRLARALGRKVLTIQPVARDARRDPGAEGRAFTPLYTTLEKAAARKASVLLDLGANQVERTVMWIGLVDRRRRISLPGRCRRRSLCRLSPKLKRSARPAGRRAC